MLFYVQILFVVVVGVVSKWIPFLAHSCCDLKTVLFQSSKEGRFYELCDFDLLEKSPEVLDHLTPYCQEIFKSQSDSKKYEMMLKESVAFANFIEKLGKDDEKNDPDFNGIGIPVKQWKKRSSIYGKNDLYICGDKNATIDTYFDCLLRRRGSMTLEIWIYRQLHYIYVDLFFTLSGIYCKYILKIKV